MCLFYVNKCSGKYENNKAAARYVHQMAEEILSLLGGVIKEIEKRNEDPDILQSLLDEWNSSFPPYLKSIGNPKKIAALIESQAKELERLQSALSTETSRRIAAEEKLSIALNEQIIQYKKSFLTERKEHLKAVQSSQAAHEREIEDLAAKYSSVIAEIEANFKSASIKNQSEYSTNIASIQKQLEDARRNYDRLKEKLNADFAKALGAKEEQIQALIEQLQESRHSPTKKKMKNGSPNQSNVSRKATSLNQTDDFAQTTHSEESEENSRSSEEARTVLREATESIKLKNEVLLKSLTLSN